MRAAALPARAAVRSWLCAFLPAPFAVSARERARAVIGALLGLLFTAAASRWLAGNATGGAWLLAPLGASAVLLFVTPASPLAQPWPVLAGNVVSAVTGLLCAMTIPDVVLAAPLAVALAITAMFLLRCLHPPGGGMALAAVLMHAGGVPLAIGSAATGSLLLILAGIVYHPLTGRRYPHAQQAVAAAESRSGVQAQDLDAVLAHYDRVLDVSRDELQGLLDAAGIQSRRRVMATLHCRDLIAGDVASVSFGTPLQEAWDLMQARHLRALPVVDGARRVVGVVTLDDFLQAAGIGRHGGMGSRLRALLRPGGRSHSENPEVVGQLLRAPAQSLSQDAPVAELLALFAQTGHDHLPIVDAERRIAGVVTHADVLRALQRGG